MFDRIQQRTTSSYSPELHALVDNQNNIVLSIHSEMKKFHLIN